jgi:polyhydroxybutyrate depolymerase
LGVLGGIGALVGIGRTGVECMNRQVCARSGVALTVVVAALVGCSSSDDDSSNGSTTTNGGTGGQSTVGTGSGGMGVTGSGGTTAVGGSGGMGVTGSGGMTAVGGSGGVGMVATGSGGTMGSGGMMAPDPGSGGTSAPMGDGGPPPTKSMGCGAANPAASGMQMLDVDGTQRTFLVSVPDNYDANTPHKLIFAWHGLGGTADQIQASGFYGLKQKAMNTVLFVAAQGLDTSNQVGSGPGWDNMGGRDVKFTSAMLDYMRTTYCVDNERIFSVGMSYGGIMSNTVGCALGDDFRAIAPMSGAGPSAFGGSTCTGQVAAWLSHGNTDMVVAFSSGQASRDHWVMANHCDANMTQPEGSNGCLAYQGCDAGYPVVWCEFTGGHMPPSYATEEIWTFFSQF